MSSRPGSGTKLSTRLIVLYSLIFLALIGLMAVAVDRVARESLIDDIEDDLAIAGGLAFESLPSDIGDYQKWAEESFRLSGYRTTLIHADGVVLADSHTDPAAMENHSDREEVQGLWRVISESEDVSAQAQASISFTSRCRPETT